MKTRLSFLFAFALIVFTACAHQKKNSKNTETKTEINAVTMHRSTCFGRCPDYTLVLHKDGLVRYTGKRFTEMTGVYEKNVGEKKVAELFKLFGDYNVDTCKREYPMLISDLPGLDFTIDRTNTTQTIRNAHFGPYYLKEIAGIIDREIKPDASWTKISDGTKEE